MSTADNLGDAHMLGYSAAQNAETSTWCNCQAVFGSQNYPGPWHEKGGEKHYPCWTEAE